MLLRLINLFYKEVSNLLILNIIDIFCVWWFFSLFFINLILIILILKLIIFDFNILWNRKSVLFMNGLRNFVIGSASNITHETCFIFLRLLGRLEWSEFIVGVKYSLLKYLQIGNFLFFLKLFCHVFFYHLSYIYILNNLLLSKVILQAILLIHSFFLFLFIIFIWYFLVLSGQSFLRLIHKIINTSLTECSSLY